MCFYRQLYFNCKHHVQWECLELCIAARDSPRPDLCQVRLPVGEVLSEHSFACRYCPTGLTAAKNTQRPPNGFNNGGGGGGGLRHPPIDPRLASSGGGGQYNPQRIDIDMRKSGGGFWDEVGGDRKEGATSYSMAQGAQGYGDLGSRWGEQLNGGFIHNMFVRNRLMGGAGEHPTIHGYPTPPPSQTQPNHQHLYPSLHSQQKSKNRLMSYPYPLCPPPDNPSPQRHQNTKRYELAFQGPQQAPLERRVGPSSSKPQAAAAPPNARFQETNVNSPSAQTTPIKNSDQSMSWSNLLVDDSPAISNYHKSPTKPDIPYFHYPRGYPIGKESGLGSREAQQLAIIDTLSRIRRSDSPALSLNESKVLYEETLAPETHRYRSDMPHFQAQSKILLKALKNGKDLGDVQFWLGAAEKLKEMEGRVEEPLMEMEGWIGTVDGNYFPPWDEHPKRGWCGWVADPGGHLEGGHGYAGTYVDENGEVPM